MTAGAGLLAGLLILVVCMLYAVALERTLPAGSRPLSALTPKQRRPIQYFGAGSLVLVIATTFTFIAASRSDWPVAVGSALIVALLLGLNLWWIKGLVDARRA